MLFNQRGDIRREFLLQVYQPFPSPSYLHVDPPVIVEDKAVFHGRFSGITGEDFSMLPCRSSPVRCKMSPAPDLVSVCNDHPWQIHSPTP